MKTTALLVALLVSSSAMAAGPSDFARQWPVAASREGAYAITLRPDVYAQLTQRDLSDLVAFNAEGEALPFGPMPEDYATPPGSWRDVAWFALPAELPADAGELALHVSRAADGNLNLDASLRHGPSRSVPALLVDVRANDSDIEAIAFELAMDAADFSAEVSVEASDDLQSWRTLVPVATIAQLRQHGQALLRRTIELPPQRASYLRIRSLANGREIPLRGVRLRLRSFNAVHGNPERQWLNAAPESVDGRVFRFRMPAPVPADQLDIVLAGSNSVANFSISARDTDQGKWRYVGQLGAFRLHGAGMALDSEPLELPMTRETEWRIESNVDLAEAPTLRFGYRPETWLLLTSGPPPYTVVAGSAWARRSEYPLDALVARARAQFGAEWRPLAVGLGPMKDAGGEAALSAFNRDRLKTWALWGVLVLGALAVIAMVLHLLKSPGSPP